MRNNQKVMCFSLLLSVFVIIFDQATKWSILAFIPNGGVIKICPYFNLLLTFNYGTSFGLLSPNTILQSYMIIGLNILCIIFLVYVFFKLRTIFEKILTSILIGGSCGNLLDRFFHGAVVDFIDLYYGSFHWPAFNFADICISCSVLALLLFNLFSRKA